VIAEDRLAALSMRRLGARLGVDPIAIFHTMFPSPPPAGHEPRVDRKLAELAARQHGVFSRAEVRRAEMTSSGISSRAPGSTNSVARSTVASRRSTS
jgi:hypothetical protein